MRDPLRGKPTVKCSDPECSETIKVHYWAKVKANDDGWFFQKDGNVWCPVHVPEWVPAWREAQRAKKKLD